MRVGLNRPSRASGSNDGGFGPPYSLAFSSQLRIFTPAGCIL